MNPINLPELVAIIIILLLIIFGVGWLQKRRRPKLDSAHFQQKWQDVKGLCQSQTTWPLAVVNADKLLDEALKKRHYKGKTMGVRLTSAQHELSDNNTAWAGHKLRNRLVHEAEVKLREPDVKSALAGIRQALKDLGAL